jgi:hypothetical protein
MNPADPNGHAPGRGVLAWVDPAADRFETAWKAGQRPRIADHLAGVPDTARAALLAELVLIDRHYQQRLGTPKRLEDYVGELREEFAAAPEARARLEEEFPRAAAADPPPPPIPEQIGKYKVVTRIAVGGQADVFRVIHPHLDRDLVLKLSREPPASGADRDRLLAEARTLAELSHENLAHVHDAGDWQGRCFLVMEYVPGRTLEQYAQQEQPAPRQAAGLLAGVARALAAAHGRGIVHRDLSPRNILVDPAGRPRLIDFGLAWRGGAWDPRPSDPSDEGTTPYMSPEQARGEPILTPRSDVFGLGAVLYRLLVGRAPFAAGNRDAALERARRCDIDLRALSEASAPRALKVLCRRMLANDPLRRPATMQQVARRLERVARPRPVWPILVAAVVVLGLGGVAVKALQSGVAQPQEPLSVRVFRGDEWVGDLHKHLPLRKGDRVQVWAYPPEGHYLSLFLIDGAGELKRLIEFEPRPTATRFVYPEGGLPLGGIRGTELLLLCGREQVPVGTDELGPAWDATKSDWPALPEDSALHVEPGGQIRFKGLTHASIEPNPENKVYERLKDFLDRLRRDRVVGYVEGVAFRYEASDRD